MNLRWRRERALISVSFVLLTISCRSQSNSVANENSTTDTVVSSTPPFQTREPDRYRAIRIVTIVTANGQTVTTRNLIARDGDLRRAESQIGSKTIAYLEGPEGRFVLLPAEKIYAEVTPDTDLPASETEDALERSPEGLLHAETGNTSYQKLGEEAIAQRRTDKYRVVVNAASAPNVSVSETLIWIDEALKMPVKSETKSADGTRVSMELVDISLDAAPTLFKVPEEYRKVTFGEFRKALTTPDSGRGIN
jgi:outer membrane lipoprotein-sorting protein